MYNGIYFIKVLVSRTKKSNWIVSICTNAELYSNFEKIIIAHLGHFSIRGLAIFTSDVL